MTTNKFILCRHAKVVIAKKKETKVKERASASCVGHFMDITFTSHSTL